MGLAGGRRLDHTSLDAGALPVTFMDTPKLPQAVVAEQTHLRIQSRPDWIEPTVAYLLQRALLSGACAEARADQLLLALHEGLTNAVIHGNLEVDSGLKEREDNTFIEKL